MKQNMSVGMLAALKAIGPGPKLDPKSEKQLRYEELVRLRTLAASALETARYASYRAKEAELNAANVYAEVRVCCEILEQDLGIEHEESPEDNRKFPCDASGKAWNGEPA